MHVTRDDWSDRNRIEPPAARERGLTLVEVLVAMLILAFVTLGSVSLLTLVLGQNKLARTRSLATSLASERLEQITSQPYQTVANYDRYRMPGEVGDAGPPATFTADYGSIVGYEDYRRVVTLNYGVPLAGMLQVVTEVTWQDLRQGQKSHRVITYVHPGLEEGH